MAGRLRATADLKGRLCKPIDALIGGTAIVNGLTLVTRNTKDFEVFGMALHNPFEEN